MNFWVLARALLENHRIESGRIRPKRRPVLKCQDHVSEALRLSSELMKLADEQRGGCEHDGCMLLDGVIRDCAWKIRQASLQWRLDLGETNSAEETG